LFLNYSTKWGGGKEKKGGVWGKKEKMYRLRVWQKKIKDEVTAHTTFFLGNRG